MLTEVLGLSRAACQTGLESGRILVNGKLAKPSYLVKSDDEITTKETPAAKVGSDVELPIIYEDSDIIVINKPAGILVHASGSRPEATVASFARRYTTDDDPERPGIVHRLDRDTSGLLIIARSATAKQAVQAEFRARRVKKTYLALVVGRPKQPTAQINLPLGRIGKTGTKRGPLTSGRASVTEYHTLEELPGYTLLSVHPLTGRTHQIRAHLVAIGHPIAGDKLYGAPPTKALGRQFLHAASLNLTGPHGQTIDINAPLPPELEGFLANLREQL